MVTFDEFDRLVQEEISLLPDYVREGLTGGVLIDPGACLHPARVADDLYILGTYSQGGITGKQIVLYYGSFAASMGQIPDGALRLRVRETLRHEFLHHMEARAGEKALAEEDIDRMLRYYERHGLSEAGAQGRSGSAASD